uniref:Uncharacterized protein n=1 Tax=Anguilla anguilla TaxID=7936 RepID=A0A0E9RQB0_ANGAN
MRSGLRCRGNAIQLTQRKPQEKRSEVMLSSSLSSQTFYSNDREKEERESEGERGKSKTSSGKIKTFLFAFSFLGLKALHFKN